MPRAHIVRSSFVVRTPRVMQLEGMFDVPPSQRSEELWDVEFSLPAKWNVGLIVGPSGSGKTTVARELFGEHLVGAWQWSADKSILDSFPLDMSIKDIVGLLSSIGFSSPPSWVRPFHVLSNGEQFRVNMARTLAEKKEIAVVDEFTSVVDRTVAKIGSAAIAKAVRKRKQQFIAVSCHYDVAEWLEPDWIYQPHINEFARGNLHRPPIQLRVERVRSSAWRLFRKHHYLDAKLHPGAQCFLGLVEDIPAVFASVLHFPHPRDSRVKREHRTVCLPDFQGVGIGNALSNFVASCYRVAGFRYMSITSHPAMIRSRAASMSWRMTSKPNIITKSIPRQTKEGLASLSSDGGSGTQRRMRASFEYIGVPADIAVARGFGLC